MEKNSFPKMSAHDTWNKKNGKKNEKNVAKNWQKRISAWKSNIFEMTRTEQIPRLEKFFTDDMTSIAIKSAHRKKKTTKKILGH